MDPKQLEAAKRKLAMDRFNRMPDVYKKQLAETLYKESGEYPSEEAVQDYYRSIIPRSLADHDNRMAEQTAEEMAAQARQEALSQLRDRNRAEGVEDYYQSSLRRPTPNADIIEAMAPKSKTEAPVMEEEDAEEPVAPSKWGSREQNISAAQKGFEKAGKLEVLEKLKKMIK